MNAVIEAGYPYELAGLLYFVFYLMMGRPQNATIYSLRSRVLALLAAIVLVGCVPLHYAGAFGGIVLMYLAAIAALASSMVDKARSRRA